jgi:hypothetical protein
VIPDQTRPGNLEGEIFWQLIFSKQIHRHSPRNLEVSANTHIGDQLTILEEGNTSELVPRLARRLQRSHVKGAVASTTTAAAALSHSCCTFQISRLEKFSIDLFFTRILLMSVQYLDDLNLGIYLHYLHLSFSLFSKFKV